MRIGSATETTINIPLQKDSAEYFSYAYNLRVNHIYSNDKSYLLNDNKSSPSPNAYRTPGYPLFLSIFVNGPPTLKMIDLIVITQALISTATLIIAYFLFRNFLNFFWSIIGSLLTALSPHLIVANSYILTETLSCFLLVLVGFIISLLACKLSLGRGITLGIVMGAASLVRPGFQYFPVIIVIFFIIHYGWRLGIHFSIIMIIGFSIVFIPWITRNMIVLNMTTDKRQMIDFLHHGIYPDFTFNGDPKSYGFPYRYDPRSADIGKDISSVMEEISRRFVQEPKKHLKWFFFGKPISFWSWNLINAAGDVFQYPVKKSPYLNNQFFWQTHVFMSTVHLSLVILGLFGCLLAWFPIKFLDIPNYSLFVARFVSLILIYYTIIHIIGAPFPRYSVPLRPFLYGIALFPLYIIEAFLRGHERFTLLHKQ